MKLSSITGIAPDTRKNKIAKELVVNDRLIGIEFEIEGASISTSKADFPLLEFKGDGSLRDHGIEIVTIPVKGQDIIEAVDQLQECLKTNRLKHYVSDRCGLHVHVDVRGETVQDLLKILCTYSIMEEIMFQFCGAHRKDNPYCVPLQEALLSSPGSYSRLLSPKAEYIRDGIDSTKKYTALNILPLQILGTIEFRAHRGSFDPKEVLHWVNIVLSVVDYGVNTTKSLQEIIDSVCADAPGLIQEVFRGVIPQIEGLNNFRSMVNGARAFQQFLVVHTPKKGTVTKQELEEVQDAVEAFFTSSTTSAPEPRVFTSSTTSAPAPRNRATAQSRATMIDPPLTENIHLQRRGGFTSDFIAVDEAVEVERPDDEIEF